jgi:hypothetical protein
MNPRAQALAATLERGARDIADFASRLTDAEWQTPLPKDGRKIGVIVHHVASIYPLEIELAQKLAAGGSITDVTWDDVHALNAAHARDKDKVTKEETLALLRTNARAAAAAIRAMSDDALDLARPTRSTAMHRSPASSCSRTTLSATASTTSRASARRWLAKRGPYWRGSSHSPPAPSNP